MHAHTQLWIARDPPCILGQKWVGAMSTGWWSQTCRCRCMGRFCTEAYKNGGIGGGWVCCLGTPLGEGCGVRVEPRAYRSEQGSSQSRWVEGGCEVNSASKKPGCYTREEDQGEVIHSLWSCSKEQWAEDRLTCSWTGKRPLTHILHIVHLAVKGPYLHFVDAVQDSGMPLAHSFLRGLREIADCEAYMLWTVYL